MKPNGRAIAVVLLLAALPVGGWVFHEAQQVIRADVASLAARKKVELWVGGQRTVRSQAEWNAAEADILQAIEIRPASPALQSALGDLHLAGAQIEGLDDDQRQAHRATAIAQYRKAIELRPADAQYRAALALALAVSGETGEPMHTAWMRALALGPNEAHVQPMLMQGVFEAWDQATPEMQGWATGYYERANAATRRSINKLAEAYGLLFEADDEAAGPDDAGLPEGPAEPRSTGATRRNEGATPPERGGQ